MKPHHKKYLLGLLVLMTLWLGINLNAYEIPLNSENYRLYSDGPVFVSPENIIITDAGIFLIGDEDIKPVIALYHGKEGLHAFTDREAKSGGPQITDKCFRGHDIYHWEC